MKLDELMADVVAALPDQKRKAFEAIVNNYEPSETCRFALALITGVTVRERRVTRLLLNELEKIDAGI